MSATSIEQTAHSLEVLGVRERCDLTLQDMLEAPADHAPPYDSVVLAEVLEHLEDPASALRAVRDRIHPGGTVWINVPVNSPAPDHLYLLKTPEEAVALVTDAGFEVIDNAFFPMTGTTLDRARRQNLTISAVVVGRAPD